MRRHATLLNFAVVLVVLATTHLASGTGTAGMDASDTETGPGANASATGTRGGNGSSATGSGTAEPADLVVRELPSPRLQAATVPQLRTVV